jgi:hypothetical protein
MPSTVTDAGGADGEPPVVVVVVERRRSEESWEVADIAVPSSPVVLAQPGTRDPFGVSRTAVQPTGRLTGHPS